MEYDVINQQIEKYFKDNWSSTTIEWPNVNFKPAKEWVRISVEFASTQRKDLGSTIKTKRYFGSILFQVFTVLNIGAESAMELANNIAALFDNNVVESTQFGTPNIAFKGELDGQYQINLSCPFYHDEIN